MSGHIRPACAEDAGRLAEIEIFNYRLNFYPIFQDDEFYFHELQVERLQKVYLAQPVLLANTLVYDDGAVKGFLRMEGEEVKKLFVESALQGRSIGKALLEYAVRHKNARFLWALEKNHKALRFYRRQGFLPTGERRPEEDTDEYLIRLER